MKKLALFAILFVVLGFGIFATLHVNAQVANCQMPVNPIGADWTPTVNCMMQRIVVLENHQNSSTNCQMPVNPIGADWTPTMTCMMDRIIALENGKTPGEIIMPSKPVITCGDSTGCGIIISPTEVKAIQSFLKKEGSFTYPTATGYYGSGTKESVKKYQKNNGLSVTGKIDDATLEKIKSQVTQIAPTLSTQIQGL